MTYTLLGRWLHVTDLHLNPLNRIPASRTESYHSDTAQELHALRDRACELNVDAVLISGDLFNLKNSALYAPEHILYYANYFSGFHCPVYTIPGNHDLPQSSYSNLNKSAYALLHKACSRLHNLVEQGSVTKTISVNDCVIPVHIHGLPYMGVSDFVAQAVSFDQQMSDGFNIVLIHIDIEPDVSNSFTHWERLPYAELVKVLPHADVICAGHVHHSYPVFSQVNPITNKVQIISKPYSFARIAKDYYVSLEDLAERHVPSICVLELRQDGSKIYLHAEYEPLPCTPFEHAFVQDSLKRELNKSAQILSFLDRLRVQYGDINSAFNIISPTEFFSQMELPEAVRSIIEEYVEKASNA